MSAERNQDSGCEPGRRRPGSPLEFQASSRSSLLTLIGLLYVLSMFVLDSGLWSHSRPLRASNFKSRYFCTKPPPLKVPPVVMERTSPVFPVTQTEPPTPPAEPTFSLQATDSPSKLMGTMDEIGPAAIAELIVAPPVPLALLPVEPPADIAPIETQPGETPMLTSTRKVAVPFLLAGWFVGTPIPKASGDEPKPAGETADRLAQIERNIGDLAVKMKKLDESLDMIKAAATLSVKQDEDIKGLKKDVQQIKDELGKLRDSMNTIRLSPRDTVPATPPSPAPGNGQIHLVNNWNRTVVITLEGVDHVLKPTQTRTITRAAGPFTYQVHDVEPPRTRQLSAEGRPYIIEVVPR